MIPPVKVPSKAIRKQIDEGTYVDDGTYAEYISNRQPVIDKLIGKAAPAPEVEVEVDDGDSGEDAGEDYSGT